MSHFKEVEFELPEDPGERSRTKERKPFFDKEKLGVAIKEIRSEFGKIRAGTSNLTPYPIDPGNFGFPAGNRLSMLENDPTDVNYRAFLEIAKQDLGAKAAYRFLELLKEAKNG